MIRKIVFGGKKSSKLTEAEFGDIIETNNRVLLSSQMIRHENIYYFRPD